MKKDRKPIIRKAKESDINGILNVLKSYNFKVITAKDQLPLDDDFGEIISVYNKVSEINLKRSFVALDGKKVIGFANWKPLEKASAKTTLICVLPTYRGLDIGKALQLARMKAVYKQGYKKLITSSEGLEACKWYIKNFDYKIIRIEPNKHIIHFLKLKNRIIWGIHYGHNQKKCRIMICDLKKFFKKEATKSGCPLLFAI
jgi:N-acetylglutamate synthase-like GNAT family acetyltransferase